MKKFFMFALFAVAAFAAGAGEEYEFDKVGAWLPAKGLTQKGDALVVEGRVLLESKKIFDISPDKVYKLEMDARRLDKGTRPIYFGFRLYAANGRTPIWPHNVDAKEGTMTTILKDVKKGDNVVFIGKEVTKWTRNAATYIALNAKADFSDLPNYRSYLFNIDKMEPCEGGYKVTLKNKLSVNIAKGTVVRQHTTGGYMYTGGWKYLASDKPVKLKGEVSSVLPGPGFKHNAWCKYAAKARVLILVNWSSAGGVTELKDIELEIENKKK